MASNQEYNENGNGVGILLGEAIPHCDLCADWKSIPRVMPVEQFVGWGTPNLPKNCFDYAWAQLKKAGYTMKSPGWGSVNKINPNIYQIYATQAIGGINTNEQASKNAVNGIKYLKYAIGEGIPVLVGVDDRDGSPNTDKVTDHFVIIVGMGKDEDGNYFIFDDNATSDRTIGPSPLNKLYCDCEHLIISGAPDPENAYFQSDAVEYDKYRVTQIRESRSLK